MQAKNVPICTVLIQLLLHKDMQLQSADRRALLKMPQALADLASRGIKLRISFSASTRDALPPTYSLLRVAQILQEFECAAHSDSVTDAAKAAITHNHLVELASGRNSITSLAVTMFHRADDLLRLLARQHSILQRLELHIGQPEDLSCLEALHSLLELHIAFVPCDGAVNMSCPGVLDSNLSSLLHVSLAADSWDDDTYMALVRLSQLRGLNLEVAQLSHCSAEAVMSLRPLESMQVTVKKSGHLLGSVMQALTTNACITHLMLHDCSRRIFARVQSMPQLTSLTLRRGHLSKIQFPLQPRLQELSLHQVHMTVWDLHGMLLKCPALHNLSLRLCLGLRFASKSLRIIFGLRYLRSLTLDVTDLQSALAVNLSWMEAFVRAQQTVGLAQPKIHIALAYGNYSRSFCIDHRLYPVLCSADFDEQRPSTGQRLCARILRPLSQCMASRVLRVMHATRVGPFVRGLAACRSWAQLEAYHPLAILMATAFVGIHVHCSRSGQGGHRQFFQYEDWSGSSDSKSDEPAQCSEEAAMTDLASASKFDIVTFTYVC